MSKVATRKGDVASGVKRDPMIFDNPDAANAFAMAIPPPKRIKSPHGMPLAVSQSRSFCVDPELVGIMKKARAAARATESSPIVVIPRNSLHPPKGSFLVIQARAVTTNTPRTRRSCEEIGPSACPSRSRLSRSATSIGLRDSMNEPEVAKRLPVTQALTDSRMKATC